MAYFTQINEAKTCSAQAFEQAIHHSDRGVQYCTRDYVKILQKDSIEISMTENGDRLENAIAERVNGILKEELLMDKYGTFESAQKRVAKAICIYNSLRPTYIKSRSTWHKKTGSPL